MQFSSLQGKGIRKDLLIILGIGLLVRLIFVFWGAELYFNRDNFFIDGDTGSWRVGFENLLNTGVYTNNPRSELGFFGRLPGYPLFMGLFYFLAGRNWDLAYPLIAWTQVLLDVISIYLVYIIANKIIDRKVALWAAGLYALYPFIIVWNPVVYSESFSVFIMLCGVWLFVSAGENKWKLFFSGALIGFGVLLRPQILVLAPVLGLSLLIHYGFTRSFVLKATFLFLGFLITYGPWPARNYFKYNTLALTQDLRGLEGNWREDVIAFMQFTYSVKSDWEPQFSSIKKNHPTIWPNEAYTSYEDSLLLERAVYLSKYCGEGFSRWHGFWKEPVKPGEACTEEIAEIFTYLRQRQIEVNPWNFYFKVPLQNLNKAIFKSTLLYQPATSFASRISSLLFKYRTLLILSGVSGAFIMIRKRNKYGWLFLGYFTLLYLILCGGTTIQMRNIEIRYFLHADVMLLIPAAYLFHLLYSKIRERFLLSNNQET